MVHFIQPKRGGKHRPTGPAHPLLNTTVTATIEDLGAEGQGVFTHPEGLKVFVTGAWPGEVLEVKITQVKNRVGFARILKPAQTHPQRINPPCAFYGTGPNHCGGCSWMFMDYAAQLKAKQQRVEALAPGKTLPIVESEKTLAYRTRAQFKSDGKKLGFVSAFGNRLVDIDHCVVLTEQNQKTLATMRTQLPNNRWRLQKKLHWSTLDIDHQHSDPSVNQRLPFAQANAEQNRRMRQWLNEQVQAWDKNTAVLELFAGSGNFTQVLTEAGFTEVTAVEVVQQALDQINEQLPKVRTIESDLFTANAVEDLTLAVKNTRVLILDPPRDGFKLIDQLVKPLKRLDSIFYISCNPATFKRDTDTLAAHGFELVSVQPLDLFPHTPHVELLARLQKNKGKPR